MRSRPDPTSEPQSTDTSANTSTGTSRAGASLPDEALLRRVVAGDGDAVADWFRREHPPVWRLCLGVVARDATADDLAQDAMLHLLDHLPERDPRRPYRPWRNTLVLNLCRDRGRRSGARSRAETAAAEAGTLRPLPDPADVASQVEVRRILIETLGALPEREREAFVLRDLEGQSTEEVAATLGVQPSSVRSLLTLARRRLRGLLGPQLDPGSDDPRTVGVPRG